VHHILVDYLESIYQPVFIHDPYACRKGKGIHKSVARLRTFIRRVTANGSRRAWYLQLDKSLASRSIATSEGKLRKESPKPGGTRMQAV